MRFMRIMSFIETVFDWPHHSFSRSLFDNNDVSGKRKIFIVLFLAFYDLTYLESKQLMDKQGLLRELKKLCTATLAFEHNDSWNAKIREQKLLAVKERIVQYFQNTKDASLSINTDVEGLENLLSSFSIEEQMLECKIGLYDFRTGQFNKKNFHKIIKTLTAMANTQFGKEGCVLFGIADKAADAIKSEKLYGVKDVQYRNFHVIGVDGKAFKYSKSLDEY